MEMFQRILCPTDFSPASLLALRTASSLALHFSGSLDVVHVVEPIPPVPVETNGSIRFDVFGYEDELLAAAEKTLSELVSAHVDPQVQVTKVVRSGVPWEEIVRLAKETRAGLLVIATHGRAGWKHFLFGSVTEKVIRVAPCPVLVIRAPNEGHDQS